VRVTWWSPQASSGWRERWARGVNQRRTEAYEQALFAWQRDDSELRQMLAAAQDFHGMAPEQGPPSISLRRGEALYWAAPTARMVEVRYQPVLSGPAYQDFSLAQLRGPFTAALPGQTTVADLGPVAVTNQRVIFQGSRRTREWAFAKLVGLAHDAKASRTLMQVTNRKKVSGLLLDPAAVAGFRFNLTLAFADGAGDRAGFVAHLERILGEHQQLMPREPVLVTAMQAPHPLLLGLGVLKKVYLGPPGAPTGRRVVQAVIAALATLLLIGLVVPNGSSKTSPPSNDTAVAVTPARGATTQPATGPSSASISSPTSTPTVSIKQPTATPTPRTTSPKPSRTTTAPTVKTVELCGAPKNPYGYNFCGGSYIRDPKPDTCLYFDCIANFWNGTGYMIQCQDGTFSMSGGRQGSCSHHGGNRRPVYE
jgi:hypothetical protein